MPVADLTGAPADLKVVLVLGGGNALGAYHAGLYEALHEAEVEPDWIVGTSIGAITGAIIAGNRREDRLDRLRQFWRPADGQGGWPMPWDVLPEGWRRTGAVVETLLGGRPGLFGPLGSFGTWWAHDPVAGSPAAYDTLALRGTLCELVDFDLLNRGGMRFTAVAVDIESGDEVLMDTARQELAVDQVRASAALLTAYPAVEVDGRLLGDGGLAMNLPLDPVMADADRAPTLCIASDLLPLMSDRPKTLGEVAGRMQDLAFAIQSRRSLSRWRKALEVPPSNPQASPSVTLVTTAYSDQQQEVAGKAMDFSPASVLQRWNSGREDGRALVRRLKGGEVPTGSPGLTVYSDPRSPSNRVG
ncbi:patatin-like phospholipase family protein [Sphingomonas sp. PL-96]|uniref:patatin-like phospholipase family protein n=1 Tax=Sphingomonas sp. PL-96 TaxID=2887201 RepID=UPI001E5E9C33|nr:patatin-like phospholipase family protein [Sphingomonas sp. PL-96]MCC2975460.1 patatin-like phospholipase family protein [Sphingomonas sp. PL-96]